MSTLTATSSRTTARSQSSGFGKIASTLILALGRIVGDFQMPS
jgi:hypothetical protein